MRPLRHDYDFELEKVFDWIDGNSYKKVLIQSAPGLMHYLPSIKEELELNTHVDSVVIDGRGRFGACDVYENISGIDAVVHFGHTGFIETRYPILYIPAYSFIDATPFLDTILDRLKEHSRIGLAASIQHIKMLGQIEHFLTSKGKTILIGEPGKRGLFRGQVVGCDYLAAMRVDNKVDSHLLIAGGSFHAMGLALTVSNPVLQVDPYTREIEWMNKEHIKRINQIRGYAALRLTVAKKIAVVDSSILGQSTKGLSTKVIELLRQKNPLAKVDNFLVDVVSDQFLIQLKELGYDVVVTAACTRLATDDFDRSPLPIFEAREVYGLYMKGLNIVRGVFILQ
jgi:2-(3-amino-3-carboxypropyl)histidine synthase